MLYSVPQQEILALINAQNPGSPLRASDITYEILSQESDGTTRVKVTPVDGVAYYGKQEIVYRKRELSKAVRGVPVRVLVQANLTVRELVTLFAAKYGFSFDQVTDFAEAELNKEINVNDNGLKVIEIPSAETSLVWLGSLSITVANDTLDLTTIIEHADLSSLTYLHAGTAATGSLSLATIAGNFVSLASEIDVLNVNDAIPEALANGIRDVMVSQGMVVAGESENLPAPLQLNTLREKKIVNEIKVALFNSTATGGWEGGAVLHYGAAAPIVIDVPEEEKETIGTITVSDEQQQIDVDFVVSRPDETLDLPVRLDNAPDYASLQEDHLAFKSKDDTSATYTATVVLEPTQQVGDTFDVVVSKPNASGGYDEAMRLPMETVSGKYDGIDWIIEAGKGYLYLALNDTDYTVDWGDGTTSSHVNVKGVLRHEYTGNGPYTCRVTMVENNKLTSSTQFVKITGAALLGVTQWPSRLVKRIQFTSVTQAFSVPNWLPESVVSCESMFYQCTNFNHPNISKWDTSRVTNMKGMFQEATNFNQPLNDWNVSKVTIMDSMFAGNGNGMAFNQPLDKWTLICRDYRNMFWWATNFNQDLSGWSVGNTSANYHKDFNTNANAAWVADTAKQPQWI